ncbi:sigma-70 family RNA polymerase sigma factor [Ruficoccus amylovorans]|uniref:Sigma-70 family RNA polymerase sigma factor n=1 Tax=Ruficoccus amylovorans TaxID=1804625 RepID=A0A842HHK2_9BACT|nr:sigma-70 family RNA polymerase sigma factor [Ruficoccus amylovorans]MBC2595650.1 sigma-70 family RNA polymerase sigma factor [Ruficoccus amylovorans]
MSQNQYPGVDARLVSSVRSKSQRLIGRYGIRPEDLDDLHQEWIVRVIQTPEYANRDHPRFTTYIGRIIDRLLIAEIRRRESEKRSYALEAYSLDDYLDQSEAEQTRQELVCEEDYLSAFGNRFTDLRETVANRQDVAAFLAELPSDLRSLALFLRDNPIEHYSHVVGISRATAFRRLQKLRQAACAFFSEKT